MFLLCLRIGARCSELLPPILEVKRETRLERIIAEEHKDSNENQNFFRGRKGNGGEESVVPLRKVIRGV